MWTFGILFIFLGLSEGEPWLVKTDSLLTGSKYGKIAGGGNDAQPGEYPSVVSVRQLGSFGRTHACGGTIYSTDYVLTAASCVKGVAASNLTIVAGEHVLSQTDANEQSRGVVEVKTHWLYNARTKENDIALVKLDLPLALNNYVALSNLPELDEEVSEGLEATIVGWGTSDPNDALLSDVLKEVTVPVVSDSTCRGTYGGSAIADSMLCAGGGNTGFCQGDTGGPLLLGASQKQIGIISWSTGCGYPGYPGVYTQVSYYMEWITNNAT